MHRESSLDIFRLKQDFEYFREETEKFYDKEINSRTYKGISGGFGSYAQRGGQKSMQRLHFPGGRITKEQMGFIMIAKWCGYSIFLICCLHRRLDLPAGDYGFPENTSSCGTHQTGMLGLRGAIKKADGKAQNASWLFMGGWRHPGQRAYCKIGLQALARLVCRFTQKQR